MWVLRMLLLEEVAEVGIEIAVGKERKASWSSPQKGWC